MTSRDHLGEVAGRAIAPRVALVFKSGILPFLTRSPVLVSLVLSPPLAVAFLKHFLQVAPGLVVVVFRLLLAHLSMVRQTTTKGLRPTGGGA